MNTEQPRNPLHGVKLEQIITDLVDTFGWEVLADQVNIKCFRDNPSVKSSLKFLRKTLWAREKVESLYVYAIVRGKPLRSQADYQAQINSSPKATVSKPAVKKPTSTNSNIWKTSS
jgi:uncharacterized protein (DUF2132 family)|tara:strand:- start:11973 stop:12320 length:348 start_codon:yes stop_codon:yes gene_type:complete